MTYTNQPDQGYSSTPAGGQPTYSEAWALIAAARQLIESTQIEENAERKKTMQAALRKNWKLWTIFQAELAVEEECNIPNDIRINMLTLAKFIDNHTVQQLPDPDPERILVLVDINRNIANGLLEGAKAEQENVEGDPSIPPAAPQPPAPAAPQANEPQPEVDPALLQGLNEEA
ncbi:flagellar biosynthesis regulator FlaF [Terasakiella sp. A23]|uniref:flagellar biosynthesis regulator FlaF n=1 Tax=Terasakiella sp. FCG-A23 TaxID=3080561 RepID=UPI0029534086|nr:flagellar biosynthesis regulator FlaF [Terasakiella sp. A23]MDV7339035.1 flagellar biosynthesis regulator FlaF [Terasakiella sp. A23]